MIWLLYLLIISIPFAHFPLIEVWGHAFLRLDWLFAGLLIVVFVLKLVKRKRLKINQIGLAILLFDFFAFLSLFNIIFVPDMSRLIDFMTTWMQLVLVTSMFFAISNMELNQRQIKKIFQLWLAVALLIALYGIYQAFARNLDLPGAYIITAPYKHMVGYYVRPSSVFQEPSYLGSYLLSPMLLLGTMTMHNVSQKFLFRRRMYNLVILSILFLAAVLSGSAGIYASMMGIFVVILFSKKTIISRVIKYVFVAFLILLLWIIGLYQLGINPIYVFIRTGAMINQPLRQALGTEVMTPESGSAGIRFVRAIAALKIGIAHPILGVGLNNIRYYDYETPQWLWGDASITANVHTVFARVLGETGFLGFFALVFIAVATLRKINWAIRLNRESYWGAIFLAFYYIMWANFIDSNFTHAVAHLQRWLDLSLACLLINQIRRLKDSPIRRKC